MDEALLLAGARSLAQTVGDKLADAHGGAITLDHDDALLALGCIEAAAAQLQKELLKG